MRDEPGVPRDRSCWSPSGSCRPGSRSWSPGRPLRAPLPLLDGPGESSSSPPADGRLHPVRHLPLWSVQTSSSGLLALLWHEIECRARRNQFLLLGALLEVADDTLGVLHHPPANIPLVDRLTLLRVFLQMRDTGKAERQFRIMKMLLPLEVDLE